MSTPLPVLTRSLACAALLGAAWLAPQEPQEPPRTQEPEQAADDAVAGLEARLADTEDALIELELEIEENRAERRGLRPAHTRARKLDEEHAALLRRVEALTEERDALRSEILVRRRLAEEEAREPVSPGVEARLEALLLGADALGREGLVDPASVLLEMYRELETPAAAEGAAEAAPPVVGETAAAPAVQDATAARLDALEQRVGELAASVGELVELLRKEGGEQR
jgi:hypothetical protein